MRRGATTSRADQREADRFRTPDPVSWLPAHCPRSHFRNRLCGIPCMYAPFDLIRFLFVQALLPEASVENRVVVAADSSAQQWNGCSLANDECGSIPAVGAQAAPPSPVISRRFVGYLHAGSLRRSSAISPNLRPSPSSVWLFLTRRGRLLPLHKSRRRTSDPVRCRSTRVR